MIIQADILEWAASYDGPLFHALLCDPPYHLTEVVKRFGKADSAPAKGDVYNRTAKGFMGKTWDGGDIAYRPETWDALGRLLYPGAFLFAFAGTRGYHRMACAIEDAGFIIHPAIGWAFGSGFPKATRIDTQVDRRAGVERTKVGTRKHQPKFAAKDFGYREKDNGYNSRDRETFDVTAPATELAQAWASHRYGGQVLKPAFEFICVAQVPYKGRPVDNITATGAGALWIDGGRIGTADDMNPRDFDDSRCTSHKFSHVYKSDAPLLARNGAVPDGRWPANLILDEGTAALIDAQSGYSESKAGQRGAVNIGTFAGTVCGSGEWKDGYAIRGHDDSGGASRFFFCADYMAERLEEADPVLYEAKADRAEREAGLDPRQVRLMEGSETWASQNQNQNTQAELDTPQARDDRSMGAADRAISAPSSSASNEFHVATINDGRQTPIDNPYQRGKTERRNLHPCIKPISLCRHLATLLLPPDLYAPRRLLIPFSGAGSEMIGALLAGWEEIVGVELEPDHCRIAEARLAYWRQRKHEFLDPSKPITAALADAPAGQLDLFGDD